MGVPVAFTFALSALEAQFSDKRLFTLPLLLFVLPVVPSVVKSANMTLQEPRIPFAEETIWSGMMGTESEGNDSEQRERIRERVNSKLDILDQ